MDFATTVGPNACQVAHCALGRSTRRDGSHGWGHRGHMGHGGRGHARLHRWQCLACVQKPLIRMAKKRPLSNSSLSSLRLEIADKYQHGIASCCPFTSVGCITCLYYSPLLDTHTHTDTHIHEQSLYHAASGIDAMLSAAQQTTPPPPLHSSAELRALGVMRGGRVMGLGAGAPSLRSPGALFGVGSELRTHRHACKVKATAQRTSAQCPLAIQEVSQAAHIMGLIIDQKVLRGKPLNRYFPVNGTSHSWSTRGPLGTLINPHMAMGQKPVPPVNIPIPTKIGSKMGGAPTRK